MYKAGRKPSRTKRLKNGYYFSISGSAQSLKPIRLMRSSKFEIDIAEKNFNLYLLMCKYKCTDFNNASN